MPYRFTPIIPGQIYHVFNRSVARQNIFISRSDYERFLNLIDYYRYEKPTLRYSHYNRLPFTQKKDFLQNLKDKSVKLVEFYAYCFMPNHFHFLIIGKKLGGITTFMKNVQNSYAKYFNTKMHRSGSVFQAMFKIVRIESDEQFLHVGRYIHLNPYSSYILKDIKQLFKYNWSSLPDYIKDSNRNIINKDKMIGYFKSPKKIGIFTLDQAEYQRKLGDINHLLLE